MATVTQPPKGTFSPKYARQRREMDFDLLTMAITLKRLVARYIMNERRVPKRWRYIEGLPALEYARAIRDGISDANDVRLDAEHIFLRSDFQRRALSACNKLQIQLDDLISECQGCTDESLRSIANIILALTQRIPKWIKSDSQRLQRP